MNDFTKEELEHIMHLWHVCNSNHSAPSQNFKNKLQSMIENYCDHIWTDGSGNMIFCGECHAYGGNK